MIKMYKRVCPNCLKDHEVSNHKVHYCSEDCRYEGRLKGVRKFAEKNKEKVLGYKDKWYKKNKYEILKNRPAEFQTLDGYVRKMYNRTTKNKNSDITKEFIKDLILNNNERCAVTGIPFVYVNHFSSFHNPLAPSIDRIDSNFPYSKDNIQIVLICINRMKNDLPNEDFLRLFEVIKDYAK